MQVAHRYEAQGSPASLWWRVQAGSLRFQPDREQIPGVDELEAVCNAEWGSGLTLDNLRRIHGKLILQRGLTRNEVDQLPLEDVARQFRKTGVEQADASGPQSTRISPLAPPTTAFDTFLSHNSQDKPIVRELADALVTRGLRPWLDERELVPGRPWQEALEEIIQTTKTAVVTFGPAGLGPWEEPEMRACLNEFVNRKLPVIPVLLPGAPQQPDLPLFLKAFTWVDLRGGLDDDGLDRLVWGITGQKP